MTRRQNDILSIVIAIVFVTLYVYLNNIIMHDDRVWYSGTTNIMYPFTTGTSVLDEWSKRERVIAIGSCMDPIPALNLRAFEGG